ncbi:MerR family transcriptional regulator [Nitratireductor kimnyeongensis]|uniref:MerR family transcriptional regulator n=1 Tax=Nitratireductor kimnyeongensis TaxID=430679 RepID=A0ABW0T8Z4_9HYPH|nr:MerR family transcriptional regulator [Nitratireductor kimnyeongensis]QZZ36133.1 MerR family transcriptional regulator [Nitratireductor kimnyeongensis]
MKEWMVNDLAKLAGVSVRTLHHYDAIGLLSPVRVGENRYRYYGEAELLRLQQILLYRELGMPLETIGSILDDPRFDSLAALNEQRSHLAAEAKRYRQLIRTIDRTIAHLKGERAMQYENLYKGFVTPEKQAEYEAWLKDRLGDSTHEKVTASDSAAKAISDQDMKERMSALAGIEAVLVKTMEDGTVPEARALDPLIQRHHAWVAQMWGRDCSHDAYAGLADIYESHDDFKQRYETLSPGFSKWLPIAMRSWTRRVKES